MENLSKLMENLNELTTIWPGMRFQPTERELIECYLKRKLREEDFHDEVFSEVDDFYKYTPWELAEKCILPATNGSWYFFTQKIAKESESKTVRPAKDGYWQKRITQLYLDIQEDGRVIGSKRGFSFFKGVQGKRFTAVDTGWVMDEYSIYKKNVECHDVSPELKDRLIIYRLTGTLEQQGASSGNEEATGKELGQSSSQGGEPAPKRAKTSG